MTELQEMKVTWEIDLDATTPKEGAQKALECITNKESCTHVFNVTVNGVTTEVDLNAEKERLVNNTITQIVKDLKAGEHDLIEELLTECGFDKLSKYLSH